MARILIAEDEPEVRQVIRLTLADQGYDIIESGDGAVAYALAVSEKPDVILLDIMMPVMDGFEVLQKLKDNPDTAAIPVIIVSARGQSQDELQGMRLGALDYIAKPWAPGELEDRVRMALTYLQPPSSS